MTKKILLIIGILVIVGIVAFLIFSSKPPLAPGESRVGFSIRDYLPFGNSGNETTSTTTNTSTNNNDTGSQTSTNMEGQLVPKLRKISKEPIAGAVIFNTGTTSLVRFIEKGTGNVYEARSDSVAIQRLTNTTIPKIIRAFWLPNASGFLAQTLLSGREIVETNFVRLNKNVASSTNETLTPFGVTIGKLPTGIREITIKPDSTKIFYYTVSASSDWYISNPDGTGSSLVMSHPLTEWLPKWISPNQIVMQNKGSFKSVGYSYSFDVLNKALRKIGLGMVGLSVNTSTDGSWSLASSGGASPKLFMIDNKNVTSKDITVKGLAEKCVWLKDKNPSVYCAVPGQFPTGDYPDVWYKGLVSTEDSIWKMDMNNIFGEISNLPLESGEKIDVVDLSLSPDETHLIFKNKIDGYLWMLRIDK
ncbi:MAG: hypothetical protein A3E02_00575 [Candidatus Zambryskibacteria bacterium RIFCSPHIGHO2_12_FULL_38_34]|uniref:Uncharacterized protein n=1 Tax=Candidatus Zambryskibacteria bacterium RIFCSPLOWO2_12_FULL_39_16 TaxID=1802775 RepID=A0A1G2UR89_9BACT|nr:MAG: hypothetical protein A3D37_00775 [Candidatus Zambryskibacteria bacterium RIFCSPHIGHO2_02_FULL_38_22]OHA98010.1 MAG: hypothetical protein A3E02_00575 [Candidatus Zambryskibacteria bacterium RIFCSPHIGHO2_12_FULL_38_34]OHB08055.1 MAG: hypothetical protein A3I19_02280 [Candidatus Zambryskibacteria bacterium RIFCSPLOWO2_02_FULL_38_13]OHB11907.1 MAG: hypothetical protein A3G46_00475 [Candidatus Zambryskibacteria bacterium RIFCSPLOWO2_12_FULL_39_16]